MVDALEDLELDHDYDPQALQDTPQVLVDQVEAAALELYQSERLERAREIVEQLIKMRPKNEHYWTLLGVIYRREDKHSGALLCFKQALEFNPEYKNAIVNLGETMLEVGDLEEGVPLLQALFKDGHDPALEPAEQDYYTRRAGLTLATVQETMRRFADYAEENFGGDEFLREN